MKRVTLRLINDRRKTATENKPSAIEIRVTYGSTSKYISTGIKVLKKQWKDGQVVRHGEAAVYNEYIAKLFAKVARIVRRMEEDEMIDLDAIPHMLEMSSRDKNFWAYMEERIYNKATINEGTRKHYMSFLKMLKEMKMFEYFQDITEGGIRRFNEELIRRKFKQATIYGHHKRLKALINDAVADGLIKENVYTVRRIRIDKGENGINRYLTEEELAVLKAAKLVGKIEKVRDLFVISCYTGMAYCDLMSFDKNDIKEKKGVKYMSGKRAKTNQEYMFVLLDPVIEILEKYNYELPYITNQKYNDYLKLLASQCGIDKPITTHWARHTAAMMLLNNNVPIEIVAKILGHANIRTTQQSYARIREDAVIREMNKYRAMM